ncbi:MAG: peptidoglycan D,D-transpeptidase FtsI family protein [Planctomycetota bacterium]
MSLNEKLRSVRVIIIFLFLLIAAFLALLWRCFYLQSSMSEKYTKLSKRQIKKWVSHQPQRGSIFDSRVQILAASNKRYIIKAEPRNIKDPREISRKLAPIVRMSKDQIYEAITKSLNPGYAKIKVTEDLNECYRVRQIYGIGVDSQWERYYPAGRLGSHVIGFVSGDNIGLGGIELEYDDELRGTSGRSIFLGDKYRRTIKVEQIESVLQDGWSIILTIDSTIQHFAREELLKQYELFEAESAVAVVAEPKTGAILAMVSLPDFDPGDISETDPNNLRNRALTDTYEPGSIFKPFTVAIALDAGVVTKHEEIFCENGVYRGKGFGRIGEYGIHKFGNLTVRQMLVKSSNIGVAKLGQRLGKERLYKGFSLFGFGKKTGIELPGEDSGVLWPVSKWTGYSVTRVPFGQEVTVTAFQIIRAFCILANGGYSVRPYLVKAMVDNNGKVVTLKRQSPAVGFVIDPEVAKWVVRNALVGVVNDKADGGTGWRAKLEKWQVFGKTGTANIAKSDGPGYSEDDYVASFVAGAPAEDPQVVVLVSIRKPNKRLGKGYTGGVVASPAVGKIIEKTLTYLEGRRN